jgi:transposase
MTQKTPQKPRRIKYGVKLTEEERVNLKRLTTTGRTAAKKINHAQILLHSDESLGSKPYSDAEIAKQLNTTERSIITVRKRFVEEGIESAINRKPRRRSKPRKLDGEKEARLVTIACSTPPAGRARWTLKLLANKLVELEVVEHIGATTVGNTLKKTNLNLG